MDKLSIESEFTPGRKLIIENGNIIGASDGEIFFREMLKTDADKLVKKYHYSHKATKNTFVSLDICNGMGVIQLGGGIRPQSKGELSTLCNPSEIAEFDRMWLDDRMPRFSESKVIGLMFFYLKHKFPTIQFIITYADESAGQKGTIYQATGAIELEGRFVDFYLLPNGERLHPVSAWHRHKTRAFAVLEKIYPGVIHIQGGRAKGNHPDEVLAKYRNMRQRKYIYAISKKARYRLAEHLKSRAIIPKVTRQLSHHFKAKEVVNESL